MAELVNHISLERKIKMASFQKRGKTWQYTISRVIDGKSKPIRKGGFKTKKEAQVAAADAESNLQNGLANMLREIPFEKYFEDWYKIYKKNRDKNTIRAYRETHDKIKNYFGSKFIQNITKRDYRLFINYLAENRSKETVRKANVHIRGCVREAVDEGIIRIDFTRGIEISGSVPAKKADEKYLNYNESRILLQEVLNRLNRGLSYYVILLALTSGMRFSEIVGLQRGDFNFKENTITINKKWGYTLNMTEGFGNTKTEGSERTIKMDARTMQEFRMLFKRIPDNINRLVFFVHTSKYKVISNGAVNKTLRNILEELNLPKITIHGCRHTHVGVLLYKKVSIYYISERLGHSTINTTLTYYAHLLKEMRQTDEENTVEVLEHMV